MEDIIILNCEILEYFNEINCEILEIRRNYAVESGRKFCKNILLKKAFVSKIIRNFSNISYLGRP